MLLKKAQHVQGRDETVEKAYPLAEGRDAFRQIFILQNAEESIFELQFDGTSNSSNALCLYYNRIANNNASPYLYASRIFKYGGEVYKEKVTTDWRGLMNTYNADQTAGDFDVLEIRKYVTANTTYNPTTTTASAEVKAARSVSQYQQNYIIYRLSDVMLMKAEALMAMAADDSDFDNLRPAFQLVQAVNTRSLENEADSLLWNTYSGNNAKTNIESLILKERLRELAFEGKRWYDLLRYNYRHVEGVDYSTTLATQQENGVQLVATYQELLNLMKRKLGTKGDAVASKTNTEARLYLPVSESELKVCPVLKQMPTYSSDSNYSKDY